MRTAVAGSAAGLASRRIAREGGRSSGYSTQLILSLYFLHSASLTNLLQRKPVQNDDNG
jgi:hypothetical protein